MQDVDNLRAGRGSLPTVPETAQKGRAPDEDRPSLPLERPRLTWAVDLGNTEVRAMSTFDLWRALSVGELSSEVRVWRVGRECWTPAIEVPELACALRVSLHEVPVRPEDEAPRITVDYVTAPPSFGVPDETASERDVEQEPPRLRESLPEMVFSPAELSQIEAAVAAIHQESPSSELPQAVVLPPRSSHVELDPERPTVLPTVRKPPRSWAAFAAAAAVIAALLAPAVASDGTPARSRQATLAARIPDAARRAADELAHGPQAQPRLEGSVEKMALPPRPTKKPVSPSKKGQKRKSRATAP